MKILITFLSVLRTFLALAAQPEAIPTENITPDYYPLAGIVTEVDYATDTVTVTDGGGTQWAFYGCEDWLENDIAALLMDGKNTPEIYDDEIVAVRYSGWIE